MKISLHKALEEKFGIGKITNKKELEKLIAVLMKTSDQEIIFNIDGKQSKNTITQDEVDDVIKNGLDEESQKELDAILND